jgi:NTE family protein
LGSPTSSRKAFVFSGGGTFGAAQVGMLRALFEHGLQPDLVVGTSAGALNAAFLAGRPDLERVHELGDLWRHAPARQIFPIRPGALMAGMTGRRDHLVPNDGLREWIEDCLTYDRLEQAAVPLHVVATDLLDGGPVVLSEGPAVPALLASTALPGIFPPIEIHDRLLIDGGMSADIPLDEAITLGATEIWVLPPAGAGELRPPRGAIGVLLRAMSGLLDRRLPAHATSETPEGKTIHVLPPLSAEGRSMFDFRETDELIDEAYALATALLDSTLE